MEIIIIVLLTLLNGFFALSEIALVSVKKSRIEHRAAQGSRNARIILELLDKPENFLSSVQVGITLIGIIAGAYGGAALTDDFEDFLSRFTWLYPYTHTVALILVIGSITFFSIIIGELVPKSIAMNNAERISLFCAPVIKYFTMATYPFVKLLSFSTFLILKVTGMGNKNADGEQLSEEELRFLLLTAGKQGVLEKEESEVHQNLFAFTDQFARSLMTHYTHLEWIDINHTPAQVFDQLKLSVHSKFPVCEGAVDHVIGYITIRDFLENYGQPDFSIEKILRKPIFFTPNTTAFNILNIFKKNKQYAGFVIDEYGAMKGMVTLHDLTEAIMGDLPDEDETDEPAVILRDDKSFLVNGQLLVYELNQYFRKEVIPDAPTQYTTIAGFLIQQLQRLPEEGEKVVVAHTEYEVIDLDGTKIDKVILRFIR